jgi:hypothetical protein
VQQSVSAAAVSVIDSLAPAYMYLTPCFALTGHSAAPCTQISMTFKNQQVLTNCTWEVKKGERVGLVGESHLLAVTVSLDDLGDVVPSVGSARPCHSTGKAWHLCVRSPTHPPTYPSWQV